MPSEDVTQSELDRHVNEYHAFKADELLVMVEEHRAMKVAGEQNAEVLERLMVIVEGEPVTDLSGNITGHEGGMQKELQIVTDAMANGGIPAHIKLGRGQKVIALILSTGALTASVVLITEIIRAIS